MTEEYKQNKGSAKGTGDESYNKNEISLDQEFYGNAKDQLISKQSENHKLGNKLNYSDT